jgi:hypothetical protein
MYDSGVVRGIERVGNLAAPFEQLGQAYWAALQTILEEGLAASSSITRNGFRCSSSPIWWTVQM